MTDVYYLVEPEVSGGFGEGSVVDWSSSPPRPLEVEYEVIDWLGDCIVTSFPVFLMVRDTAQKIASLQASGVLVVEAIVSEADEYRDINPGGSLPDLVWLQIAGIPGLDDFGLTRQGNLVVSRRVLEILLADGLTIGKYAQWDPGMEKIPGPPPWPPGGLTQL